MISDYYAKDAYKYYFCTPFDGRYDIKPIDCQYESFVVINHQYSKDKSNIFFDGSKLSSAESSTFELIADGYAKDKLSVYFRNVIVEKADPTSFSVFKEKLVC